MTPGNTGKPTGAADAASWARSLASFPAAERAVLGAYIEAQARDHGRGDYRHAAAVEAAHPPGMVRGLYQEYVNRRYDSWRRAMADQFDPRTGRRGLGF